MKRVLAAFLLAILILSIGAVAASALQDDTKVFYVRYDYNPRGNLCEDGSKACPFNTLQEARNQGTKICEGRTFEIHLWNKNSGTYEYYRTISGRKPLPGMGLPLAWGIVILVVGLVGVLLVIWAFRLQRKRTA